MPIFFKNWIKIPNQGYIEIFEHIRNGSYFKIVLWFVYITVFAPVIEEILFRGFLQDSIGKLFKKNNLDVFLVSFIFSLFHIVPLSNVVFAFIVGIVLSKQRKKSGSINSTILTHCLINFTGLLYGIIDQFKS